MEESRMKISVVFQYGQRTPVFLYHYLPYPVANEHPSGEKTHEIAYHSAVHIWMKIGYYLIIHFFAHLLSILGSLFSLPIFF
jgi:hypothetical protein